jgi:formylglycine-generating enzyme required for sulfatase activity
MRPVTAFLVALSVSAASGVAGAAERVRIGAFAIDRTEVTIGAFRRFAVARDLTTAAEHAGGGFEYAGGWTRRVGWNWGAPFGTPGADDEPAVHVTWAEARAFCAQSGGRLPSLDEWRHAAFVEEREHPEAGLAKGQRYAYPVGDTPEGMNVGTKRHVPVGTTRKGVNGLHDMGGNVWEWLADRRGEDALTAGGSWWYGPVQTQASAVQWKPADFYAVYVGFRCAYDGG